VTGPRVVYRRTGTYDAVSDVAVEPDGMFRAEDGGYVTRGPRDGRLSPTERADLARLVAALGEPTEYPVAARGGFASDLFVDGARYTWPNEPPTAALVRFLSAREAEGEGNSVALQRRARRARPLQAQVRRTGLLRAEQ
jgi:hypothetical protein